MFGFEECSKEQKAHVDTLVDYFIFSLEGQLYVKEKFREHDEKKGIKPNSMMLDARKFQEIVEGLIKDSERAKKKSVNYCDNFIFEQLKPTLAVHERSFEDDREMYKEIFGEEFKAAIVEKAKKNGWKPPWE
jgi:hypothetical protein